MVIPGTYEHYKGNRYEVLGIGLIESTEEPVVIYKPLYDDPMTDFWVRPVSEFEEFVEREGQSVPRFKLVGK